jgi:hypothetical protein
MFHKGKAVWAALGLLGAIGVQSNEAQAGICFSNSSPWGERYTCSANGTIDTRDVCSPFFPGGAPICVPRLSVNKNSGLITKADGLDINGNIIQGCRAIDTVADGVPETRGAECSQAEAVQYEVTF